ncbi:hypothetical protein D3C72_2175300 [compost metagenome]
MTSCAQCFGVIVQAQLYEVWVNTDYPVRVASFERFIGAVRIDFVCTVEIEV